MNIKKSIYSVLGVLAVLFGFTACSPDGYDLGDKDVTAADLVEGKAFSITHDSDNPNIVYLKSLMSSKYTVLWEHPQGRTQKSDVTLKIPFAGEYTVKFGVETRGGVVYGDPVTFKVDDFCADFVTAEAWTLLAGGVGQSKTWIYDNGSYGYCSGELSYGDPDVNADMGLNNFTANWDPGKGHCGDDAMWGSTMTFSLQGKAGYEFYNSTSGVTQSGLFSVDDQAYTLAFTDADLMHPGTWDARLDTWRTGFQIIELDENHMRVAYVRVPGDWGGKWVEVFNYVSKEYADNYVPATDPNPVPQLAETWQDDITNYTKDGNTYRTVKWKLAETADALAYCDLYGSVTNGAQKASNNGLDYALTLNAYEHTYTSVDADGNEVSGDIQISDDGFIYFSNGLQQAAVGADGTVLKTNNDKTLRVLSYSMDSTGELTDLCLGYDVNDSEGNRYKYQGFHFTPGIVGGSDVETFKASMHYFNTGWTFFDSNTVKITGEGTYTFTITGSDSDPYGIYLDVGKILGKYPNADFIITGIRSDGKSLDFDDSLIDRGEGDTYSGSGAGLDARRYILNPWNSSNYFMANGYACLGFTSSLEVDLKVVYNTGTPFLTSSGAKKKAVKRIRK